MICINCLHKNTRTANSRAQKKTPQVWRRRVCPHCHSTFTTYERPSFTNTKRLVDKNTPFNLGVLIISIAKSFTHNINDGATSALGLAQTIEDKLITSKEPLSTDTIAATTYEVLKRYDELAAVQYGAQHQLISSLRRRGRPSLRES